MRITSLFAPSRCLSCRAPGPPLCPTCRRAVDVLDGPRCLRCGAPTARDFAGCRECEGRRLSFASAAAAASHAGPVADLVSAWKDRGLSTAGAILAELVIETIERPDVSAIVAVPAVRDRVRWRGVDPPAALAAAVSVAWSLPVVACLERIAGRPQRGLSVTARRANALRSFASTGRAPGAVLLVDDVYTTGATATACAIALRRAGATRVDVVTAARAVRRW